METRRSLSRKKSKTKTRQSSPRKKQCEPIRAHVLCEKTIPVLPWNAKYNDGWDSKKNKKVKPYYEYPKISDSAIFAVDWTDGQKASFKRGDTLIVTFLRSQKVNKNRYTVDDC